MAEQNINVAQQDTLETVASNVDTINTNAARLTAARATKIDNIGATGDTGGSSTAGTLFGKLNKIISDIATFVGNWTATRAGYIDNIRSYTITNNTASKTGVLSAKLAYIISLLENTTYGLNALKTTMGNSGGGLKSITKTIPAGTNLYKKEYCFGGLTAAQTAGLYCVHVTGAKATHTTSSTSYFNIVGGYFYINTQGNSNYTVKNSAITFSSTFWSGSSGSNGNYYIDPVGGYLYSYTGTSSISYTATADITLTFYYFS